MNRSKIYFLIILIIATPVTIYLYFLRWKTNTIYGDDLFEYYNIYKADNIKQIFNQLVAVGKFRPVHGLCARVLVEVFNKNVVGYYFFNFFIQSINTYLVALLSFQIIREGTTALLIGLVYGLSRFSFYDFSQLFNGGALEGLAITFFLLSLFFLLRVLLNPQLVVAPKTRMLLWATCFANLSIYTHERYIVLFPFIFLVVIFFPGMEDLGFKRRTVICAIALLSVLINFWIKRYVYNMPFFVGTGGTNISFSFVSALEFLKEAMLSIFQLNSGPEYLVGIIYSSLPGVVYWMAIILALSLLLISLLYLLYLPALFAACDKKQKNDFTAFIFLAILFGLCLLPAIVTIRLEQRWLQAPFAIFLLMLAIALNAILLNKSLLVKKLIFGGITGLFIMVNYAYLKFGVGNLYMKNAEHSAFIFKEAVGHGVIKASTEKVYIWEPHSDINSDNGINWALGEGYIFKFYENNKKTITFIDSTTTVKIDSAQVVCIKDNQVIDITKEYKSKAMK